MAKFCKGCDLTLDAKAFYVHKHHKDGLSSYCRSCTLRKSGEHYHKNLKTNPTYRARIKVYSREWHSRNKEASRSRIAVNHRKEREECLARYGGVCACCGESQYEFLAIDHIDGGGSTHRKEQRITKMARWLKKNQFPPGYRVLCHNCNMAFGQYGYCPHSQAQLRKTG